MELEKGRAKPKDVENADEDTLEARLERLAEIKAELKDEKQKFMDKTRHLRESAKSLENIITEEVKKLHHTVSVGNIRAEYKPQVIFKMKREQNNGE